MSLWTLAKQTVWPRVRLTSFHNGLHRRLQQFGWWLSVLCLTPFQQQLAEAQDGHATHVPEMRTELSPEALPPPRHLEGIGNVSLKITSNAIAQRWFNQGLNLYHDFWDYESTRAFEQAVRSDPLCAMCYWGLYLAQSNYHSTTKDFAAASLATAAKLRANVSEAERLYIEASIAHERAMKTMPPDNSEEIAILRRLIAQSPSDTQARIFLANALPAGFDPNGPTARQQEMLTILQAVLKLEPKNSAANHYYIHALEGLDPKRAIESAKDVARLAPASGHMVHMPGHIYYVLGDYKKAEKSFAMSMQVDERYMQQQHVSVDDNWNYIHNMMYAVANLVEEGKIRAAEDLSGKLVVARGEMPSTAYAFSARDAISRLDPILPVLLRTADWERVIRRLNPASTLDKPNLQFLRHGLLAAATGMKALERRDVDSADEAIRVLDAQLREASETAKATATVQRGDMNAGPPQLEVKPDALAQPLIGFLSIMSLELRGSAMTFRSRLADALKERPRSGFPLFGVAMSSEGAGDVPAASTAYVEFLSVWAEADADMFMMQHAAAYLSEHVSGH